MRIRKNRPLRLFLLFLLFWISVHIIYITIDGMTDYKGAADVAIILGNRVYADGHLSSWLKGRTDKALQLYREKKVKKIFASGGISSKEDGGYPEGDAMKKYLIQHGIPDEDIISDNYGRNTYYTAKNYLEWNKKKNYQSVIVVSQFYHITRIKYIFRRLGAKNVHGASSDDYEWRDIVGTLREVPAFYKYLILY